MSSAVIRYRASATEADLLRAVQDAIALRGGRSVHVRDARRQDTTGLPDVLAVAPIAGPDGPHRLLGIEIKTDRDKRHPDQEDWLRRINLVPDGLGVVLRPVPKREDEWTLDEVLAMIGGG